MNTSSSFSDFTDSWWDTEGPYWTLHAINPIRLAYILKFIKSGKALDVGCGGGILSESLLPYFDTTGIDIDNELIKIAKKRKSKCKYKIAHTHSLVSKYSDYYDLVACLEVLEHTENPKNTVVDIAKMTKPGGYVFLSTINRNPFSFIGAILAAEHILKIVPKNTHHYEYLITPDELIEYASDSGLKLVDMQGISYNPFTKTFSLVPHTLINYIACFEKV